VIKLFNYFYKIGLSFLAGLVLFSILRYDYNSILDDENDNEIIYKV
jgi:hypothetical protein